MVMLEGEGRPGAPTAPGVDMTLSTKAVPKRLQPATYPLAG